MRAGGEGAGETAVVQEFLQQVQMAVAGGVKTRSALNIIPIKCFGFSQNTSAKEGLQERKVLLRESGCLPIATGQMLTVADTQLSY